MTTVLYYEFYGPVTRPAFSQGFQELVKGPPIPIRSTLTRLISNSMQEIVGCQSGAMLGWFMFDNRVHRQVDGVDCMEGLGIHGEVDQLTCEI